jgi:hypothetical protein
MVVEAQERVVTPLPAAPDPASAEAWQPPKEKLWKFDATKVDVSIGVDAQLLATRTTDSSITTGSQSIFQEQTQGTSPTAGLFGSFHQQFRGWLGYDVNFGYTRTDVEHSVGTINTLNGVATDTFAKSANRVNLYEFSVGYVVKTPTSSHRLQTFFEAGPAGLIYSPSPALMNGLMVKKRALMFGVGSDLRLTDHLGLRIEYRGLLTQTPDSQITTVPTESVSTVLSEPTISLKYTFGAHKRMQ